jgi:hypothetical protein
LKISFEFLRLQYMRPNRSLQANPHASVRWLAQLAGCSPSGFKPRDLHPGARGGTQIAVLNFFVRMFVNTFGITQPAPGSEARAGRFIALMLTALLVLLLAVAALLRAAFTH